MGNICALFVVVVFMALLWYLWRSGKNMVMIFVLLLSFVLKVGTAIQLKGVILPASDSLYSWNIANFLPGYEEKLSNWHAYYLPWANWDALTRLLVRAIPQYGCHVVLNTCFNCVSCMLIYAICKKQSRDKTAALLCACIYSWYLPQYFFNLWNAPDTVAMTFFLLAVLLLFEKKIVCYLLAGLFMGIGNCLKPVGPVYLIALLVVLAYDTLHNKRSARFNAAAWALVMLLTLVLPKLAQTASEKILDTPISDSSAADFLCIGLRTDGEGQLGIGENSMLYIDMRNEGYTEEEASRAVFEYLKQDWSRNYRNIPNLIIKKLEWAWQDDLIPHSSLIDGRIDNTKTDGFSETIVELIETTGGYLSQASYTVVMFLAFVGGLSILKNDEFTENRLFYMWLVTFGYSLLLLLSEAQSRYKSNIMPFVCILTAAGITRISKLIKNPRT